MRTAIISLGGSMIVPDKVNVDFLLKFKEMILQDVSEGNRAVIVCGGGKTCRNYNEALDALRDDATKVDKDWVGIMATRLNAEMVRVMFGDVAYSKVVYNPHDKIETDKKVIIAAGHEPGCTTDADAVILAKQFDADLVVNTTDVDYVYDKDPRENLDAVQIEKMSWTEFFEKFGDEHKPGMHVPFGITGSKIAVEAGIKVAIVNGSNLENIRKLLCGEKFVGTIIG